MNKNYFVKCGVCGTWHRVRIQAGFVNDYPVRFYCGECNNRICGDVHLDPSAAKVDFTLEPGAVASTSNAMPKSAYLVECSGELPTRKMERQRIDKSWSFVKSSPFLNASGLMNPEDLQTYISELVFCANYYRTSWKKVRSALQLFNECKDELAAKLIGECERELLNEDLACLEGISLLGRIARLSWFGVPMLACKEVADRAREAKQLACGLEAEPVEELIGFYASNGVRMRDLLGDILALIDQFAASFPRLIPAFTHLRAEEGFDLRTYGTSSCTVEDLSDLYRDAYELIGKLMRLIIGLDNIVRDGSCFIMARGLPAKSYDKLPSAPKAKILDCVDSGAFSSLIRKCWSSSLRNAFSHGGYRVNSGSQCIHVIDKDGSINPENDMWLLSMMCQCIGMLRELLVMREVVYVLVAEDEAVCKDERG